MKYQITRTFVEIKFQQLLGRYSKQPSNNDRERYFFFFWKAPFFKRLQDGYWSCCQGLSASFFPPSLSIIFPPDPTPQHQLFEWNSQEKNTSQVSCILPHLFLGLHVGQQFLSYISLSCLGAYGLLREFSSSPLGPLLFTPEGSIGVWGWQGITSLLFHSKPQS